jgi:hypothetical protein
VNAIRVACGLALLAITTTSCATERLTIALQDPEAVARSRIGHPRGRDITAYVLRADGRRHPVECNARLVGDSLIMFAQARPAWGLDPGQEDVNLRFAANQVWSVEVERADVPRSIAYGLGAIGVLGGILFVGIILALDHGALY